jgi:hypothetical protein
VTLALYSTIWMSLALFATAQYGFRWPRRGLRPPAWTHAANAAGLALCVAHITFAMGSVHGWSHEAAAHATAAQTESVYGWRWGGGLFVNYLFVIVWAVEAFFRRRPNGSFVDGAGVTWALRIFYGMVIFNAAIVFARGSMRALGVLIVTALLLAWRPVPRRKRRTAAAL